MPDKTIGELFEELHERYNSTVLGFSSDPQNWTEFISRSCYNFRLRFDQQVLIFAQAPNATIVATSDQWYKMYRPVVPKSNAIKVFEDIDGRNNRYTRYYEQSATKTLANSKPIPFWTMQQGYKGIILDALKSNIDDLENKIKQFNAKEFEQQIIIAAEMLTEREIESYYDEILTNTQESELDKFDEDKIVDMYTSVVANSVAFAALSRLGYNAGKIIDTTVFNDIRYFNTPETIAVVGTAQQKITQEGLDVIAKAIRSYEREVHYEQTELQRNDNQRKARIQHGIVRERTEDPGGHSDRGNSESIQDEGYGDLVSVQRRASGIRSVVPLAGGRGPGDREILNGSQRISQGTEISDVRQPVAQGRTESTLQRTSDRVHSNGNAADEANGSKRGTEQRTSEQELVEVRTGNAEPQRESAGDSSERTRLQLTDNQGSIKAENDEISDSAFSVSNEPDRFKPIYIEQKGDFIEAYGESAKTAAQLLELQLVQSDRGEKIGFPDFKRQDYNVILNSHGYETLFENTMHKATRYINEFCLREYQSEADFTNEERVSIAFTEHEDSGLPIQVYADLYNWKIVKEYGGKTVNEQQFDSLEEMTDYLEFLDFNELVYLENEERIIEVGDRYEYRGTEYTVTSLQGDHPDEVQVSYNAKDTLHFTEYEVITNIYEDTLLYDSEYLGNISKDNKSTEKESESDVSIKKDEHFQQLSLFTDDEAVKPVAAKKEPLSNRSDRDKFLLKNDVMQGTNFENGKFRISEYYKTEKPSAHELAGRLKKEYRIGGHSSSTEGVFFADYDSKGITITLDKDWEKVHFTWNEVAQLIVDLIEKDEYITQKDIDNQIWRSKYTIMHTDPNSPYSDDQIRISNAKKVLDGYGITAEYQPPAEEKTEPDIPVKLQEKIDFSLAENPVEIATPKVRYQRNVAAIKTLKAVQTERRNATAEEQVILSKYVGWGGLQEAFDQSKWTTEYKELRELLTDEEYKAARESTLTAFFTPPEITKAVWKALNDFGFKNGNVLEPSCGIGNFIGMIPEQSKGSRVYAVELDNISAGISQQLYQSANVFNEGYEKFIVPNNFFDVAVGNVPFGDFKVSDRNYDKHNFLIHDYFFAKTLDKVRPGGIVALVTSQGTLDKENPKVRKYIAQRAELIGAIRLPDNTFKGNAGTDVTSDIIFLQKREKMTEIEPDWVHLDIDENGIAMNSYFVEHPEMIMGEMQMKSGPFGPISTCKQIDGTDLSSMLDRAIKNMSAVITETPPYDTEELEEKSIPADPNVKENSFTIVDGDLYYRQNSRMFKRSFSSERNGANKAERIKAMLPIRDSLRRLIDLQTSNASDSEIITEQHTLNDLYDNFVATYGRLGSRSNTLAFYEDHSANLLLSLENYNEKGEFERKADIFTKRTISPHIEISSVSNAGEALAVSLGERAEVDIDYMCSLSGMTEEQLYNDLAGSIFINPAYNERTKEHERKYIAKDEYLSGNVRTKLRSAEFFNKESGDDRFSINIEKLKEVIPKDLSPAEISAPLGATWIPIDYINQFIRETFDVPYYYGDAFRASYTEFGAEWSVSGKRNLSNFKATTVYGTKAKTGLELLEDCLNLRNTKVYDPYIDDDGKTKYKVNETETALARDKQEELKQAFEEWIWKDPKRRQDLVNLYNEKFNSIVPRVYDGSHLTYSGMNPEYTLKEHQKNAVARIVYGGNTLLAHTVGAGKTFEMITAAQESKRLGLCSKSLIVVPKHLIKQWKNEYMKLYPGANILVATPKDFTKQGRRHFTAKIATGDYDAIIITQPQFDKIQLTPDYQKKILSEEINRIANIHDSSRSDLTIKATERILKKLQTRFDSLSDSSSKDDMIYFEELGIDRIFVDESQAYKNMYHPSKMTGIPGLANTESKRATGMHMICRYLDEKTNGKGVIFATGTPLANSLSEVYTIMYNLQYRLLEEMKMTNFDSWVSTFAKAEVVQEQSFDSKKYNEKLRFTEFSNVPELKRMVFECMDVQTAEMLDLPVPDVKRETILLDASEHQQDIMESFAKRADDYKHKRGNYNPAEMLMITSDARKMALDQRVYDPILPESETCKTAACADKIVDIYHRTDEQKLTQMVFCDLSTPGGANSKEFCVYDDLREKLIERGITEDQIAFIHDADTDEKKDKLFKAVREGNIRVIIGSTQKMGTGTNVQQRLIALHHLDCPWRPMDLEQQEGRIIRQGNTNEEVQIYTYVTEGTFDSNMYAQLARKQKAISQFYSPDMTQRKCEDISESVLSYLDVAAITSGNPLIKEQAELQRDVTKLQRQRTTFYNEKYALEDKIELEYPERISRLERVIPNMETDLATAKANPKTEDFAGMTIKEKFYDTRKDAGTALIENAKITGREKVEIGSYRGFKIFAMYSALDKACIVGIRGKNDYEVTIGKDAVGNITRLDNVIASIKDRLIRNKEILSESKTEYAAAQEKIKEEFPHEEELKKKKARIEQINAIMSKDKNENQKKYD